MEYEKCLVQLEEVLNYLSDKDLKKFQMRYKKVL